MLTHIQLDTYKDIQLLSNSPVSPTVRCQPLMHGLFYCRYRPFISFVLKLMCFCFPKPQVPQVLSWLSVISSHLLSSTDLIKVQSLSWHSNKDIQLSELQYWPQEHSDSYQEPNRCSTNDCYILYIKIQPAFSPLNHPYFQYILHELPSENTVADGIRNLTKIKVYRMHHSFCFHFLISM